MMLPSVPPPLNSLHFIIAFQRWLSKSILKDFSTYFAYAYKEPVVGEVFSDFFRYIDNNIQPVKKTSPVQYVEKVAKDVYKMYTAHTIYFVQIKKQVN